ncbi:T9SS type B sorting domain-containing protein [Epilithonimonas sp. JDS]|uniref:T9SS type B sorting domain-containing protein n=1 Tax=Epilithonimonas sp. JDS TaxID=2902797 RepID=UPI001E37053C|nr:T9SS type B sorting domain-containing protein [Epilithonimonas sp. JDS]MCD9856331.1 T9SS type B sorting domain-containing protein [Epilithonimonas sp. JDS]
MKKVLQILIFLVFSLKSFAQMDTEHWFAPIFDTFNYSHPDYDNSLNGDFLYLSTDSTDEFEIIIYSGEVELNRVSIRKGNPKYVKLAPKVITTLDVSDTFKVAKRGLHLVGSRKFFANLRILRGPHAEIINSKGFAGLGTDFYAITSPLTRQQTNLTSQVNILATENNTSVKINGYNPDILFQNGSQAPELNMRLNKGDSFMVSVPNRPPYVVDSTGLGDPDANYLGLLGANIHSDKPITVTNGNFNGTYVNDSGGNDILMDQATPVNRLGREYVVAKGNGPIRAADQGGIDSERVIVIATKDNTKFTLNDSPIVYTLDKGKYKIIYGSESYIKQGTDIYNLYIKSTEDIYVYQFLAGNALYDSASGGMNMIPSLNCLLPNQIVELPEVNQIGTKDDFETTVNIITKKGAQVTMNGESLNGLYGPYSVSGTSEWVLFSKKNVKGNLSIYSTEAVTAGVAGGSNAVGYGGFFGGFSSIPQITKTGDCTAAQKLQVDHGYDSYEWYYNNVLIASGANLFFIDPENYGSGNYYCKIFKKDCGYFITDVFVYNKCPQITTKSFTESNCKILKIPVAFSSDPLKQVRWDSVLITKQAERGEAYFDLSTQQIIFDPKNTDLKAVTFKYYFESTGTLPDSEEVTVTVNIAQINLQNPKISISSCLQNQIGSYNLKDEYETKNNDPSISRYAYYKDATFGQIIPDSQLDSYTAKPGDTVFVKIFNSYDCYKTGEIYLNTFELPVIKSIDVKGNTSVTINVTQGKPPYLYYIKKDGDVNYLPQLSDYSSSNTLPITEGKGNYTVYVKSADDCDPVTQKFLVIGVSNVITPNDDGKNDIIDMSVLNDKVNPKFQIFTRNTKMVFEGTITNNFIWTGKQNGTPLPSETYWYLLQWQDFEGAELNVLTGWILLKNRNSD